MERIHPDLGSLCAAGDAAVADHRGLVWILRLSEYLIEFYSLFFIRNMI